ncbi:MULTISPECIES: TetR/AcrR family transcriptional regulator [unclassified Streptomyces]|uniref:TetR/AcrR family transcriptional regulator n=1 Tax=unclassified Streptomyces TaxID=2593676 RepID=UPI002251E64A|nr:MULTISPECIES: TetR/AcrR family transcriptional regulator [unclassified Streptomyces]MCX5435598.1 TetR/AcrR family transcriptional regulator [Streptomyces sp. NBC_00063]WSE08869.1 TetR/AcrR family transcriptional regulator [Streptomyces sp. NBC_01445]
MAAQEKAAGRQAARSGKRQQRRQPSDPGRQRDPVGTRRSILAAAGAEFGTHGFEGARVVRIAEAAGVSHQLITYYFGGKRGLHEALSDRWPSTAMPVNRDLSFDKVARRYVHLAHDDPGWVHRLAREQPDVPSPAGDERAAELLKCVEELRARQARGELRGDIDVGVLFLVFFAASVAPVALRSITREFTQQDPGSEEFIDHYADQVARIMAVIGDAAAVEDAHAPEPTEPSGG